MEIHPDIGLHSMSASLDEMARKSYMLQEKRSKLVYMGDHAFSVVAPKYWNELPDDIRNIELPLNIFKKKLKAH